MDPNVLLELKNNSSYYLTLRSELLQTNPRLLDRYEKELIKYDGCAIVMLSCVSIGQLSKACIQNPLAICAYRFTMDIYSIAELNTIDALVYNCLQAIANNIEYKGMIGIVHNMQHLSQFTSARIALFLMNELNHYNLIISRYGLQEDILLRLVEYNPHNIFRLNPKQLIFDSVLATGISQLDSLDRIKVSALLKENRIVPSVTIQFMLSL